MESSDVIAFQRESRLNQFYPIERIKVLKPCDSFYSNSEIVLSYIKACRGMRLHMRAIGFKFLRVREPGLPVPVA